LVSNTCIVNAVQRRLGSRIALLRHRRELTQEALAERTGYSVDFIGLVERGVNAPTLARLEDIANALDVKLWHLFCPISMIPPDASTKK